MDAIIPQNLTPVTLPLSVGDVQTVDVDGDPFIVFRHAVDTLGISYSRQVKKLKERSWSNCVVKATVAEDEKIRDMLVVNVPTFLMWLGGVNENRVASEVRPRLIAYQRETMDVVHAYWTSGGAINPRATDAQVAEMRARLDDLEHEWEILASELPDYSVRDVAAMLCRDDGISIGQNTLFKLLRQWGMVDRKDRPYARFKKQLVRRLGSEYRDADGELRTGASQLRVTVAGVRAIHRRFARQAAH